MYTHIYNIYTYIYIHRHILIAQHYAPAHRADFTMRPLGLIYALKFEGT